MTPEELIAFEDEIVDLFHAGKIPYPVHYSGRSNEEWLIQYFKNYVKEGDWVFSTWRSHYHALLHGMPKEQLKQEILNGNSMHIMDDKLHFYASSIVGGCCPIATGVAFGIELRKESTYVHCFVGDGAEDQGVFYEAVRYAYAWKLPVRFIIEDNSLSVDTTKLERINNFCMDWPGNVVRYKYTRHWPHVQTGKFVKEYM